MANLAEKPWLVDSKQEIDSKIEQGLLPHALLLLGSYLAGQDELGDWLSKLLLCEQNTQQHSCGQCKSCLLVSSNSHPDLFVIDTQEKNIGVDVVREAGGFLQKTAQLSGAKVVVIRSAENMTESAANALLKTLEEPTDNSFLLLVCNNQELLLPTIISRSSVLNIQPPTGKELAEMVQSADSINDFSNIHHFAELTNSEVREQFDDFNQQLSQFLLSFDNQLTFAKVLVENIHAMRWLAQSFVHLIRIQADWGESLQTMPQFKFAQNFNGEQLWQCQMLINAANKQLKLLTQANKGFTIESLLFDIEQVLQIQE
ncbi:DNA polymerase III subunit delta' [Thalassotalea crassostreae]|uniref:DNA polymerase III subunit delta' n=1 Tax=Thalassotalea crassostreae TaxID=1763536 RepID=UPI000838BA07|nr:DNA polymerase III subunit delta' [Thalassotalea crassostreae]